MDPVTAIGIASAVVQFLEFGGKVTKRLVEFINASPGDVPRPLADISVQLPLIIKSLSSIKDEASIAKYDNDTRFILQGVVLGCLKLARELDVIATKISPKPGESLSMKLKKVLSSLKNEDRITEIDRGLHAYVQILILHQVVNPTDVQVGPPADVTYYEVKEIRTDDPMRRQAYLTRLHEAFRQASRCEKTTPDIVVLTGKEGVGKTQLALEYCQEARDGDLFRAIFWLDASSPASLKRGLENTAVTIRKTKAGSTDEKLAWLGTFLADLWHSWLFVLDNYEPKAFETESLRDVLPAEGHGAVLVLTRTLHALDVDVEIRVHKALTKSDYTVWRGNVSRAIRDKQMSVVVDALADGFDVNSLSTDLFKDEAAPMVQLAAEWGFAEAVQLFLEMGADPCLVKYHGHVLSEAAESGDIPTLRVYLDWEDKTGYRMEDDENYSYAVSRAVVRGRLDVLEVLLKERGDKVNGNGRWLGHSWGGNQALEMGAESGYLDCLKFLVDSNKFPDSVTDRASILRGAIIGGHMETIRYLIDKVGCDPNELDHDSEPALIPAIDRGGDHTDTIVSLLLDAGARPNVLGQKWGYPPIHVAADKSLVSTIKLLLDHGADPSMETRGGENALEHCLRRQNSEIQQMLASVQLPDKEAHAKYYNRILSLATRKGDRVLAAQALKEADINFIDEKSGETPLMTAIVKTQLPMARMLVRKGARQDIPDKKGNSPLRLAASKDMDLLIRDLANAKGSPGLEESDKEGFTPLMIAAKAGHCQAVATLLGLGADRDAMNDFGETALDIAEESRNGELIAILQGEH